MDVKFRITFYRKHIYRVVFLAMDDARIGRWDIKDELEIAKFDRNPQGYSHKLVAGKLASLLKGS